MHLEINFVTSPQKQSTPTSYEGMCLSEYEGLSEQLGVGANFIVKPFLAIKYRL
jgi:hypothetical protein